MAIFSLVCFCIFDDARPSSRFGRLFTMFLFLRLPLAHRNEEIYYIRNNRLGGSFKRYLVFVSILWLLFL